MSDEKLTPEKSWKELFLQQLRLVPNITKAADFAGVSRQRAYKAKEEDSVFSSAWGAALDESVERLEYEMHRRAYEGVEEPLTYKGKVTGTVRKYSDTLAIFLAKAHRPEKYRERSEVVSDTTLTIKVSYGEKEDE